MSKIWELAKGLARTTWFREGTVRRSWIGPYSGIRFKLCPQVLKNRMRVFYGAYEPEVTETIGRVLRPGMIAYNVGAHVGIHSLYMAKRVGRSGTVCAFEAWPANFRCLESNASQNQGRIGRLVLVPKAVFDRKSRVAMTEGRTDGTHHVARRGETESVSVEATTLDDFAGETGLDPNLILVDVEGAEMEVLRGSSQLLRRARPDWLLEHHGPEYLAAVTALLGSEGYTISPVGSRHVYATRAGASS